MSDVKVSVIVPVYNTEKYLKQCLDSLISQTLEYIQIVIIDDGSTDSSASIIKDYSDRHPDKIVFITKENGGQAIARNLGLQYCTGEYIGFMDSDDYARSDMYEKLYNAAKQKNADYAACAYTEFYTENEQTKIISEYKDISPLKEINKLYPQVDYVPWLNLYKRDLFTENGIGYPVVLSNETLKYYVKSIPDISKVVKVEEPLIMHRVEKSNAGLKFKKLFNKIKKQ